MSLKNLVLKRNILRMFLHFLTNTKTNYHPNPRLMEKHFPSIKHQKKNHMNNKKLHLMSFFSTEIPRKIPLKVKITINRPMVGLFSILCWFLFVRTKQGVIVVYCTVLWIELKPKKINPLTYYWTKYPQLKVTLATHKALTDLISLISFLHKIVSKDCFLRIKAQKSLNYNRNFFPISTSSACFSFFCIERFLIKFYAPHLLCCFNCNIK